MCGSLLLVGCCLCVRCSFCVVVVCWVSGVVCCVLCAVGYSSFVVGRCLFGCWLFDVGAYVLVSLFVCVVAVLVVVVCWLLFCFVCGLSFVVRCLSVVVCGLLFYVACCVSWFVVRCSLLVVGCCVSGVVDWLLIEIVC